MAKRELPSPEILRQLLRYEPETGKLFWREAPPHLFPSGAHSADRRCKAWNGKYAGKEAFTYREPNRPYPYGDVFGVKCYAHRAIIAMETGQWPEMVDHLNGDKTDNRRSNLKPCSHSENMRNRRVGSRNKSNAIGVYLDKSRNLWAAEIVKDGSKMHLGRFKTLDEAKVARKEAEAKLGFGPIHGLPIHLNP